MLLIKDRSIQVPKDKTIDTHLERVDKKDITTVERFLRKLFREEELKEKMKQQINLNAKE